MNECIICNGSESSIDYVEDPSINSLKKLLTRATSVSDFVERTIGSSAEDLKTNNSRYMKIWWKLFFGIYFKPRILMLGIGYWQGYSAGYIPNRLD